MYICSDRFYTYKYGLEKPNNVNCVTRGKACSESSNFTFIFIYFIRFVLLESMDELELGPTGE
jgi:hypothetical protein